MRDHGPGDDDAQGGEGNVVIDATALTRFDSSALAVLIECHRLAKAWGRGFEVANMPPKLAQLASLYAKTGTRGQAELAQRVLRVAALVTV